MPSLLSRSSRFLLTVSAILATQAPAQTLCPQTTITGLRVAELGSTTVVWDAPSPNVCGGVLCQFEVLQTLSQNLCGPFVDYAVVSTQSSRSFNAAFCPRPGGADCGQAVKAIRVRLRGCPATISANAVFLDNLPLPQKPVITAAPAGIGQVVITIVGTTDRAYYTLLRAAGTGAFVPVTERIQCPPSRSFLDGDGRLFDGTYRYKLLAFTDGSGGALRGVESDPVTVTLGSSNCPVPSAPQFSSRSQTKAKAGGSLVVNWSEPQGLPSAPAYLVEASRSSDFSLVNYQAGTRTASAILPIPLSGDAYTFYVRVRALLACGSRSEPSRTLAVNVTPTPALFEITKHGPSWVASVGGTPPQSTIRLRNVGGLTGTVNFTTLGGFFDVTPSSLTLPSGADGAITLAARREALATAPAAFAGALVASGSTVVPAPLRTLASPVTLLVINGPTEEGSRAGTRIGSSVSRVSFSAPPGQNPAPKTLTIDLKAITGGTAPVYVSAAVGPGGSWLVPPPELTTPLGPVVGSTLRLTLAVDRSRRSSRENVTPLRTLLRLRAVGAKDEDAAVVEVFDVEPPVVVSGIGGRSLRPGSSSPTSEPQAVGAPPGGTSFVVPTVVNAAGAAGASFYSDGWLRNDGDEATTADFFFTPRGGDGVSGPGVLKTTLTIPGDTTLRLNDLLASLLQTTGSGQLEVRSVYPERLTLRNTVESITGGDATLRFGTEIPVSAYAGGIGKDDAELIVTGIGENVNNRTNLILAETLGSQAVVSITAYGSDGSPIGTLPGQVVPPFGQIQLDRVVTKIVAGATATSGSLAVKVTSGDGRVVAVATVLDNKTNSFSAVQGSTVTSSGTSAKAPEPSFVGGGFDAETPTTLIIPAAARVLGAFNTQFFTSLQMTNGTGTAAKLRLTYFYNEGGVAKTSGPKSLTLAPRASLSPDMANDVLANLFGLRTEQTSGWIRIENDGTGDDVKRVSASAAISAQVDPADSTKGVKSAQVSGLLSDHAVVATAENGLRSFAGAEKSTQKRTNLVIVEIQGQPCSARVAAYNAEGQKLAERTFPIAANQYFQINDVFGDTGLGLGDGPFQDVQITAEVVAGSGTGRIVSFVSVNDNISKNPEIFLLNPPGPPLGAGSSIFF